MKQRFSKEQIIEILQEAETAASKREECWRHGIIDQTLRRWHGTYGGMAVS